MAATGIQKISFSHEALINWLVENPHRQLRDCAAYFGYTQAWLSQIIHSDIFQAKLAERQNEVFALIASDIPEKLRGVTDVALEKLGRALEETEDPKFALDAADKLLHRMGYAPASARNPVGTPGGITQNNTQNVFMVGAGDLAAARALQHEMAVRLDREEAVLTIPPSAGAEVSENPPDYLPGFPQ